MRVLITGAAGHVGQRLIAGLEADHDLRLGDVRPIAGEPRWTPLDVTSLESCLAAAAGMEAVIHLAVASGLEGEVEDDAFNQRRFDINVKGTWNILEAARRHGIRRFVHTSSIMVAWGYPPGVLIPGDAPPRTVGTYSLTKHLAENVCEPFARDHGLSILCLRIAKPIDVDDPVQRSRIIRPQWLPFAELIEAYRRALAAPEIGFEIVTVVGAAARDRWDLGKAERVLGFRPTLDLAKLGWAIGSERQPFDK